MMPQERMAPSDSFCRHYAEYLDGWYDCVDRIVLNGFFTVGQTGGGFRTWWRSVFGSDDSLDDAHLMRWAGRFSRRLRAWAKQEIIPILEARKDDRMHATAEKLRPRDPGKRGVFCITVHRAPNSVWMVEEYGKGGKNLRRKAPNPWVNHYAFHIQDPDWGHITIKICGHAPFNVQVALNGHEYVARQASQQGVAYTREKNCFTDHANLADLQRIAETLRSPSVIGRLKQVCERWLYTACLRFLLPVQEQKRSGMHYHWSNYQLEYSRNLLFRSGQRMEEIFQSVIDRTRRALDARTVRTLFGRKRRPRGHRGREPRFEVEIERPAYDLIVFKVHYGLLTLKMYLKGERNLRFEAIVHNARKEFPRGYGLDKFAEMVDSLRTMLEHFMACLRSVDACWVTDETLERLPRPSHLGAARVAGLDLNRARVRAVMLAVVALSPKPHGFQAEQVAALVREILGTD